MKSNHLPGTQLHQQLLNAICAFYRGDQRVLALIVFGSLGRGDWDSLSDIDFDIVVRDDAQIQIETELRELCESFAGLGQRAALIIPDGDEGEVVLESLLQLSIRYHPLRATHPNILDSMRLLEGELDRPTIIAAGESNRRAESETPRRLVERALRQTASASVYLLRDQSWLTVELLHRARSLLIEVYARTHGGERSLHFFETSADPELQQLFGETIPGFDKASLRAGCSRMLDLFENDLEEISNGTVSLRGSEYPLIANLRLRVRS